MIDFTPESLLQQLNATSIHKNKTLNEALEAMEIRVEDDLSKILYSLGIVNSKKADRKSLPIRSRIVRRKHFSSYFHEVHNTNTLKREVLRSLLVAGACKVRFYVEIIPEYTDGKISSLEYSVNWFEHSRD